MFNTALKNIRRSPYQALTISLILFLNLFIITVFALVSFGAHLTLSHFETKPQVIAYLKDDVSDQDVNQTINRLLSSGQVKDVNFVSKTDALELYKQSVGNDPLLLGTVTELGEVTADILPASLEVSVKSIDSFDQVVEILQGSEVVSITPKGEKEIDFPRDVITELISWTKAIRSAGLILIFTITLASLITVSLIISMKIASRRLEINTMKLIGARSWFVIKPYLAETVIYSLTAAFFAWIFAYIALLYSTPFLIEKFSSVISFPVSPLFMGYVLAALLVFSFFLGIISALLAALRFANK